MKRILAVTCCLAAALSACDKSRVQVVEFAAEPDAGEAFIEVDHPMAGGAAGGEAVAVGGGMAVGGGQGGSAGNGPCMGPALTPKPANAFYYRGNAPAGPVTVTAWAKTFFSSTSFFSDVMVDSAGDVVAAGIMSEAVDFGSGPMPHTEDSGWLPFLVKFAPNGQLRWARIFPGFQSEPAALVGNDWIKMTVGKDRTIYLAGLYFGPINLGDVPLQGTLERSGLYVASFTPDGLLLWSRAFNEENHRQSVTAIAVDSRGAVWLAGGGVTPMGNASRKGEIYVAKLCGNNGTYLHGRNLGDGQPAQAFSLAVLADDSVVLGAASSGDLNLTPAAPVVVADALAHDAVLIRFDTNGVPLWGHSYGGPGRQAALNVQSDGQGGVYVHGIFSDTLTGLGNLVAQGRVERFLARVEGTGNTAWARSLGEGQLAPGNHLLNADAQGRALVGLNGTPRSPALLLRTVSVANQVGADRNFAGQSQIEWVSLGPDVLVFGGKALGTSSLFGLQPNPANGRSFIAHLPQTQIE